MRTIKIFVSSPGDVEEERQRVLGVIERVQRWFRDRVTLVPVCWEHKPLSADADFQSGIESVANADVALFILWSRLGTPLGERFRLEDGRLPTGTEWEFSQGLAGCNEKGKPTLLVYRRSGARSLEVSAPEEVQLAARAQWNAVEEFWRRHFLWPDGRPRRAFHSYASASELAERFEKHLMELVRQLLQESGGPPTRLRTGESPYRGLRTYEFEHAPIFFGRSKAIQALLQSLRDQTAAHRAFVLVVGMSGSGKSSLVRAGLLPLLTSPAVVEPGAAAGAVRRAVFRPSDALDPFASLAAALLRDEALGSGHGAESVAEMARALRAGPEAAIAVVHRELGRFEGGASARLCLILDQAEELFTAELAEPGIAREFVRMLDALARGGRVWVLATLRGDFYGRLAEAPEWMALKEGAGHYDLLPPTGAEIREIICQPAQAAGLVFGQDPNGMPLDRLLEEAAARERGALPLLAFTLEQLYEQRENGILTYSAYAKMGELEGAIATRAREVFEGSPPEARAEFGRVIGALVDVSGGEDGLVTRRRPAMSLVAGSPAARILVNRFLDARLLVTESASRGEAVVDVAHESLFQRWPELKEWIERNRHFLQVRSSLSAEAALWLREGRDKARLLPEGKPLQQAEFLLQASEVAVEPATREYVEASVRRVKRRRQLRWAAAGAAVLLLIAGYVFEREQKRSFALQEAAGNRGEAESAERGYQSNLVQMRELLQTVQTEQAASSDHFVPASERAALARREAELAARQGEAERLVQSEREDLERAARLEASYGGISAQTKAAFAQYFLARWREADESRNPAAEQFALEHVRENDPEGRYAAELARPGALIVNGTPEGASIWVFRYLSYDNVRTNPPVVPRLVPVPFAVARRTADPYMGKAADFLPGDLCLTVRKVAPGSVAANAGLAPGDLVIRLNGQPCGDGLFVTGLAPGGPAATAGIKPLARLESLNGADLEQPYDLVLTNNNAPEWRLRVSGKTLSASREGPVAERFGLACAPPSAVVGGKAPAGGMSLLALHAGQLLPLAVPEGKDTGLTVEPTAYPLILTTNNMMEMGCLQNLEPGSYLLLIRRDGFEDLRYPVVISRGETNHVVTMLLPAGTTPEGFVWIPPGPFAFGGDFAAMHPLPLETNGCGGFFIAQKEVTFAEWFQFVNDPEVRTKVAVAADKHRYLPQDDQKPYTYPPPGPDGYTPQYPSSPVLSVTWDAIQEYLEWRNRRAVEKGERVIYDLPDEHEWEKAARGVDGRIFPWGDRFDFSLCISRHRKPEILYYINGGVEPRDESPFGILDLAGSRREWCKNPFSKDNPYIVIRGGAWRSSLAQLLRIGSRDDLEKGNVFSSNGFRLVAHPRR